MKKFLNIFRISDLRQKLAFTGALLLVYRLGGKVPVPGVDKNVLQAFMNDSAQNSLLGLYDTFVGGFFSQASIFTLGIMALLLLWVSGRNFRRNQNEAAESYWSLPGSSKT